MHELEHIQDPDLFAASVFNRMQQIIGSEPVIPEYKAITTRHVSVEEALQELLQLYNTSAAHPLTSLQ